MKRLDITLLLFLIVTTFSTKTYAYDIAVENADGVTIYYYYINNKQELSVTDKSSGYNSYSGSVVIPSEVIYQGSTLKVTSIGESAFQGCKGLTSIEIPSSVTSIIRSGFSGCTNLSSINIPSSVTSIGEYAFSGCKGLTSIEIPSSVTSIGSKAFSACSGLTSIEIPSSVTSIGDYAFQGCYFRADRFINNTTLTGSNYWGATLCDMEKDDGLLIKDNTIVSCRPNATSVNIPSSVTSIGDNAFYGRTGLTSIEIPSSVTSIGSKAFSGCSGLTSIEIPSSVTSIGDYAFQGCTGLTSIEIPSSVTSIGDYAFYGCTGLTSIEIPSSVTSIGSKAFSACSGLTSIEIPSSVTSIGDYAFFGCTGLTSITISSSDTKIYDEAFCGCSRISRIYLLSSEPPYIVNARKENSGTNRPFEYDVFEYAYLHVPKGCYEAYSSAYGWRYFQRFKEDMDINGNKYYVNLRVQESEKGFVEQAVKVDETYTMKFGKKRGASVKKVMFNGEDVTDSVTDNSYTTPVIKKDSEIIIQYDEADTDINGDGNVDTQDVFEIYQYMQQQVKERR